MPEERLPVVSTRMNCKIFGNKLKSLQKGLSLLKCKSDALEFKVREAEHELRSIESVFKEKFNHAFEMLSKAELHGSDTRGFIKMCGARPPTVRCEFSNICGVGLTTLILQKGALMDDFPWRGGHLLKEVKSAFDDLLEVLVSVVTKRSFVKRMEEQLAVTNKRKNSLEHKMIPCLEGTVHYIAGELDEMEREDFYRLKRIQEQNRSSN